MKSKFYTRFTMVIAAMFLFGLMASAQTTIEVPIILGGDDAEEVQVSLEAEGPLGAMDLGSSDLELIFDHEPQYIGLLFKSVAIPAGSTIDEAFVQFAVDVVKPGVTDAVIALKVSAAKEASAADITEADFSISSRPRTEAKVDWSPGPSVAEGDQTAAEKTSNIAAVIQEVVNQDGWVSGNNILVVVEGDPNLTEDLNREYESFDGDALLAPVLTVTYSEGGGGGGGEPVSISANIISALDDAEEIKSTIDGAVLGSVDRGSSDLELAFDKEPQWVGLRFTDVQVPAGVTIDNAYVQFTVDALVPGTTDAVIALEVYGTLEADAAEITETLFDISARPATTAKVAWAPPASVAVGDKGANEATPDIAAVVQEIIAVEGWAAGNHMMIVVTADVALAEDVNREMESFDGDPDGAAVLNITYSEGGGTRVKSIPAEFTSLVYPNPAEGRIYINNPSTANFDYEIYTISGRMVSSKQNNSGSTVEVDMSGFVKGMYFVNVRSEGNSETHKLILK